MKQPWWALLIVALFGVGVGVGAAALFGGDSSDADGSISMGASETSVPSETTTAPTTTTPPTTTTAPPTTTTTTTTTAPTTTTTTIAPTTTAPVQPPLEQVQIVVANGSGIGGIAGNTAQQLRAIGYPNVEIADGGVLSPVTVIYVAGGLEPTAARVAADLRVIDPAAVEPIVAPLAEALPILPAFPDVAIIVFLGQDQA
jgi:hypothetical protein